MSASLATVRCLKCSGVKVRRHHRRCPKRGFGHQGRGASARWVEIVGADWGVPVTVRRGRHGKGDSLPVAELRLGARMICFSRHGTTRDLQYLVADRARVDPARVKVVTTAPGTFCITIDKALHEQTIRDIHTVLREDLPGDLAFEVRAATAP